MSLLDPLAVMSLLRQASDMGAPASAVLASLRQADEVDDEKACGATTAMATLDSTTIGTPRKTVMGTLGLPNLPKFGKEQERWAAEQAAKNEMAVPKPDGFNLGQLLKCGACSACGRKPGGNSELRARAGPTVHTRELQALKAKLAAAQEVAVREEALKADLVDEWF